MALLGSLVHVCGCPVPQIVSVDVCLEGDVLRLPSLAHNVFPNFSDLATLMKFNTEMRICGTESGTVTLILRILIQHCVNFFWTFF